MLLLNQDDHVLLLHAKDPDQPAHHWWELPGGGADPGETLPETARRERAEETGILLDHLGPHLGDRETRFHYRGREHHRRESVYDEGSLFTMMRSWRARAVALCRFRVPAPVVSVLHAGLR